MAKMRSWKPASHAATALWSPAFSVPVSSPLLSLPTTTSEEMTYATATKNQTRRPTNTVRCNSSSVYLNGKEISSPSPTFDNEMYREKSSRGDKVYYRLLTYDAPYNSNYPIDAEDDSLSLLHASRIPPPGLAQDYVHYICTREGIHYSRAKLYTSTLPSAYSSASRYRGTRTEGQTLPPAFLLAQPTSPLRLRPGGCGSSRANPLILYLDLDPGMDRTQAVLPVGKMERRGREVAKKVRKTVKALREAFLLCFGSLQKVPKGME